MNERSNENKPYTIKFEPRDGYLYVYGYAKQDSFDTSLQFWTEIAAYCKNNKFSKVLVEEDFATDTSITEKYNLVSYGHKVGLTGIKIAFVDLHPEQLNDNIFSETVACNRGLIGKVFTNVQEAETWLLS